MEDDLFNIDVVRDFIALKGGKVKNHDLVTHFKTFLNDPRCKASNRQKFKVFVNTLAAVKLDETGEKVLVLKKKFRDDAVAAASNTQSEDRLTKVAAPKAKLKDAFQVRKPSENDAASSLGHSEESLLDSIQKELVKSKVTDIEMPTPDTDDDISNQDTKTQFQETIPDHDKNLDNNNLTSLSHDDVNSKVDNKQFMPETPEETKSQLSECDEVFSNDNQIVAPEEKVIQKLHDAADDSEEIKDKDIPVDEVMDKSKVASVMLENPIQKTSPDEDKIQSTDETDRKESTMAVVTEDEVQKTPSRETTPNSTDIPVEEPVSVKDRAKHLNKMSSESELPHVPAPKKSHKKLDSDGDSMSSMTITLDPVEREWLIASAKADYHPMAKLLNTHPNLAKRKDFITGTALHWAAKHGNVDIVKLLCGTGALVNARSTGGYTPLHLASMHDNENVIEILVEGYGADSNIRDFSGKKPKQYLKNAASARVQQILQVRRSSQSVGFKRTGSYSAKIGTSGHFGIKASTAMRTSWADGRYSVSRSPSQSPKDKRKGYKSSEELSSMPPPQDVPLRKKRSKRFPADNLGSSSNPEINKSESDPFLQMSDTDVDKPLHQSASYTSVV